MDNNTIKEIPLFILDDKAYIFIRIWSLIFISTFLIAIYILFDGFHTLIEHDRGIIVGYILSIYIIVAEIIKLLLVISKKNKKIEFYKNRIVTTHKPREINLEQITNIDKFKTLFQYDGRKRLRYKGFMKFLLNLTILCIFVIIISHPKITSILILYFIFFYFFSIAIYSLLVNKKTQIFDVRIIDIEKNNEMISLLLDNSEDTKKIKEYFKIYKDIDIEEIPEKVHFRT